jgi:hypothetical protein
MTMRCHSWSDARLRPLFILFYCRLLHAFASFVLDLSVRQVAILRVRHPLRRKSATLLSAESVESFPYNDSSWIEELYEWVGLLGIGNRAGTCGGATARKPEGAAGVRPEDRDGSILVALTSAAGVALALFLTAVTARTGARY